MHKLVGWSKLVVCCEQLCWELEGKEGLGSQLGVSGLGPGEGEQAHFACLGECVKWNAMLLPVLLLHLGGRGDGPQLHHVGHHPGQPVGARRGLQLHGVSVGSLGGGVELQVLVDELNQGFQQLPRPAGQIGR